MNLLINFSNEDEAWVFERTARQLQKKYGHTEDSSIDLINRYYNKFTNPEFCILHGIALQKSDFFCHEESIAMADRVQFYEAMGNSPDEMNFIQWQRAQSI